MSPERTPAGTPHHHPASLLWPPPSLPLASVTYKPCILTGRWASTSSHLGGGSDCKVLLNTVGSVAVPDGTAHAAVDHLSPHGPRQPPVPGAEECGRRLSWKFGMMLFFAQMPIQRKSRVLYRWKSEVTLMLHTASVLFHYLQMKIFVFVLNKNKYTSMILILHCALNFGFFCFSGRNEKEFRGQPLHQFLLLLLQPPASLGPGQLSSE